MFSRCSKVCFAQKTVKVGSLCNSAGSKRVRSRMNGIKWCLPCLGCKASMCFGNIEIVTNFFSSTQNVLTVDYCTEHCFCKTRDKYWCH